MENKLTLQQKLDRRKINTPPRLYWWIYHFLGKNFLTRRYNCHIVRKDDVNDCKGPCFVIFNHLSRYDHWWLMRATYPRRYNIIAGHNEFFRSHLHGVFKLVGNIPKKNFTTDVSSLKAVSRIIKQGGCVAFSPEGMSSIYGHNQPVVEGTGHMLRHYNIPVYFLNIKGSYLTEHKVCLDERLGRVDAEISLLFTPEQLQSMTDQEVNDKINLAFKHDDYEWNKTQKIKWKNNGNICAHYNDICYRCPKCGKELTMVADKNYIKCTSCGNGATMDDYYNFIPFDKECVIPESPSKWVDWEREVVIKEIRENPTYSFSTKVKVGDIPKYKWISHKKTSEPCGEGTITVDHEGIHFKGVKHGEEWNFELSYKVVYSLVIVTDVTFFSLYVNGEYFDFFPDNPCVGKILLLVEEMHRLHVNTWKNFPWCDYMYPEKNIKKEEN